MNTFLFLIFFAFCIAALIFTAFFYYSYRSNLYRKRLANIIGLEINIISDIKITYQKITIPKKTGGKREIHIPSNELKNIQKRILHRVLHSENIHRYAHGFRKHHSIVDNARPHCNRAVVIKMDIRNFFPNIDQQRVSLIFKGQGWDIQTSNVLANLCCYQGKLPQGAPTSPALSNIVLYRLDSQLSQLAWAYKARYTRYADDLSFSLEKDIPEHVRAIIKMTQAIVEKEGFRLHFKKSKIKVLRAHQHQQICGITVNSAKPTLSRKQRRKLRAIRHRMKNGKPATMTVEQLKGWDNFNSMVENDRVLAT